VPTITTLNPPDLKINDENEAPAQPIESETVKPESAEVQQPTSVAIPDLGLESPVEPPAPEPVKVYEDPFTEQTVKPTITVPVLESRPVNEDAAALRNANGNAISAMEVPDSPEKEKQNTRLLDSGITKIKAKTLEVHGFRKLQSLLRDSRTVFTDDRLEAFLMGMFHYLEDPLTGTPTDKALDIKAQILTTIKLLLKRERDNFRPHVSQCLESLLQTRSAYDGRAHIVSGLEMLADELVAIGDGSEIVVVVGRRLQDCTDASVEGCRALSMGLHILRQMLEHNHHAEVELSEAELLQLSSLARRCLESPDSGVRMSAVQLCVTMHARLGEARFWDALRDVKDDPKSLITYYIVKRQREQNVAASPSA
jgi:CLIP-associating protein 1/2